MKIAAVIPAAGQGKRLGSKMPKALVPILGRPLLVHTLTNLKGSFRFHEMIVAVPAQQIKNFKETLKRHKLGGVHVIAGGLTRAGSVKNGLKNVSKNCEWVLIHDAARPLVSSRLVQNLIRSAKKTGAAIVAMPVTSTVKRVKRSRILKTEDRGSLYLAQTPQLFRKKLLVSRYRALRSEAFLATDEAALFDRSRIKVMVTVGDQRNIKITTPQDIDLFKFYMGKK